MAGSVQNSRTEASTRGRRRLPAPAGVASGRVRPASALARGFAVALAAAAALAGCGGSPAPDTQPAPSTTAPAARDAPAATLAFPVLATKNTTRVASADPVVTAAAVARAVYPGGATVGAPPAVAIADRRDWRGALAGAVLMAPPTRAPLLYSDGGELPPVTRSALGALRPSGAGGARGPQAFRLGTGASPPGLRTRAVPGNDAATLAANIDALRTELAGRASPSVVVVSAGAPSYAMAAAAWAAKSGDPVLFVTRNGVPAPTVRALAAHGRPRIYVLGPATVVSPAVTRRLQQLGTVSRIGGPTAASTAVAFARYADGRFGWGVIDPGHGFAVATPARPGDAGAAAPLSASGMYGPLLLTDRDGALPRAVREFLLDVRPGYSSDPVRGVYNRAWIVGDARAVTPATQATIDGLLEIEPVSDRPPQSP